jgi:hypothetical protein
MDYKSVPIVAFKWYVWHSPDRYATTKLVDTSQWCGRVIDGPYPTADDAERTRKSYAYKYDLHLIQATSDDEHRWQLRQESAASDTARMVL